MPLTESLLFVSPVDLQQARLAELDRMASRVQAVLASQSVRDPAQAFNQVVFVDFGFVREVDDKDLRFSLLGPVLASRRGGCVGLGSLYLALGERLQIPVEGILVPGHFFVRMRDSGGRLRNVELLRKGEAMPDGWYREKYAVPANASAYMRALSKPEVVAVLHFNRGNEARVRGRWDDARATYRLAASAFPQFAEAQASLGLACQLLGDMKGARAAYEAAWRIQPGLPGLENNLQVLNKFQPAAVTP